MAYVESCKDDEAFARGLQALYDADDYEGDTCAAEESVAGRESEAEPEEFIPEGCRGKSGPTLRKKRLKKRRDFPSEKNDPVIQDNQFPEDLKERVSTDTTDSNCAVEKVSSSGNETLKTASCARGTLYSEKEESLFLEGLNMFGRNWCKISNHVGTRDRASITSHAQKHLIQMWIRGDELPEEVAKGGSGYSLSGKQLDPNSSSVRPYVRAYRNRVQRGEIERTAQVEAILEKSKYWSSIDSPSYPNVNKEEDVHSGDRSTLKKIKTKQIDKRDAENSKLSVISSSPLVVGADGKTDYSRNRPQRGVIKKYKRDYLEKGYDLVKCLTFSSGQPFSLVVSRVAVAIMDLHSHLLDTEIVGVLAGTFDPDKKECVVHTAIPCDRKSIDTDTTISVEATEESLADAACSAQNSGFSIIGWYHSHPVFSTDPSNIDVNTQHEHQVAFHGYVYKDAQNPLQALSANSDDTQNEYTKSSDSKPFIGAICGPYNVNLPTNRSEVNWFVVANPTRRQPYRLKVELTDGKIHKKSGIPKCEVEKMLNLAKIYKLDKYELERHRFNRMWRKSISYKSKLISSLKSWLQGDCSGDEEFEIHDKILPSENASGLNAASPAQLIETELTSAEVPSAIKSQSDTSLLHTSNHKNKKLDNLLVNTDADFLSIGVLLDQISLELDSPCFNSVDMNEI